ncbi:WD repeat domain-containing protein, partial [Tetrabaena socialis]
ELHGSPAAPVTAVALSRCGNFGIVGSASGRLDRYNMQSGLHRGTYCRASSGAAAGPRGAPAAAVGGKRGAGSGTAAGAPALPAHDGAVVGCASDATNRLMVSAGLDGVMRVWDFRTLALRAEVVLGGPAVRLVLHPNSGLAAVALADASIRMYDIEAPRLVRRFRGHRGRAGRDGHCVAGGAAPPPRGAASLLERAFGPRFDR